MKKILFVLSVSALLMVVGCSTPTTDTGNKETQNVNKPANDTPSTPAPQQPETPAQPQQPQTPSQPETPAQPQTPSQPQQPQTPTQPEQPPATEQPPAPESQPENEDSEEETQEETEQGGESEENTEQEEETEQGGESEEENEQEEPEEETPQVPEDKSPFEYVKPACVNLADYTYVGDYIFADTMNFAEWKYSNAETDYRLAFEKVARVKNDNPHTRIYRGNHNDPDTEIAIIKATRYKIYVKTSVIENAINEYIINLYGATFENSYDGTRMRIVKNNDNTFTVQVRGESNPLPNYIAY